MSPSKPSHLRRALVALAAVSLPVALLLPGANGAAADATAPAITFAAPTVADPVHAYGEPDIKIGVDGATYVSGPWGTGTQRSIWNQSLDGARTFLPIHGPEMHTAAQSDTQVPCPVPVVQCPGGGDTEIAIDHTGKVYYSDLAALVTLKLATWDPHTHTLATSMYTNGEGNINGIDRQWMALWDPPNPDEVRAATGYTGPLPVNYQMWNEAIAGGDCTSSCEAATYSTDGLTYSGATTAWEIANDGNTVIDQQTGTVLEAISVNSFGDVGVAIATRGSDPSDPALRNSQIVKIADLPLDDTTASPSDRMSTRDLFPVVTMDSARNAYVVWITRAGGPASASPSGDAWQAFYSYASAASGWTSWSTPRKISSAPANTNIMPWAVAGSAGRLAMVWYGTDEADANPSTTDTHQAWNVYLATVTGADTASPTVTQQAVVDHPVHYGTICLEGTGCILSAGNRNNADFFQVAVDPRDGAIAIAYNDTSNELIQDDLPPPVDGSVDHRGAAVVMVARQNGGIGLFGTKVRGPRTLARAVSDAPRDANFDPVYERTYVPELDLRHVNVRASGDNLLVQVRVSSLDDTDGALQATGSSALDYVVRWQGAPVVTPTGERIPIYYAAVEVLPGGQTQFFAGLARSVDLCSVSACTPHVIDYPAPPNGGTSVDGVRVGGTNPGWQIIVPRSLVGDPQNGAVLDSLQGFSFARLKSASLPLTNAEAEAGITPVMVDGTGAIQLLLRG